MWILFGILSFAFTILNFFFTMRKNKNAQWASICALSFNSLTLIATYRLIYNWVNHSDWVALMDVVPSMFNILTGYVLIILFANVFALILRNKKSE